MKRFQPMGKRGERREVGVRIRIEHRDLMLEGQVFPGQMDSTAAVVVLAGIDSHLHPPRQTILTRCHFVLGQPRDSAIQTLAVIIPEEWQTRTSWAAITLNGENQ